MKMDGQRRSIRVRKINRSVRRSFQAVSRNLERLRNTLTFSSTKFQSPEGRLESAGVDTQSEENNRENDLGAKNNRQLTKEEARLKTASQFFQAISIVFNTVMVPSLICLAIVTTYFYAVPITLAVAVTLVLVSKYYNLRYWYYKTKVRDGMKLSASLAGPSHKETEIIYELDSKRQIPGAEVEWEEELVMEPQQKRIAYTCVGVMFIVTMVVLPLLAAEFAIEFMADNSHWSLYVPYLFGAGIALAVFFVSRTVLMIIIKGGMERRKIYMTRDACSQVIIPCTDIRKDIVRYAGVIKEDLKQQTTLLRRMLRSSAKT